MKVLIAEDEADTLQLLKVYFSARYNSVVCATNGVEALEVFQTESPDLVLLDVRMPRLDGWRVLESIRTTDESVPVLMLTALDSPENAVKGLNLGADDYLRKPFDLSELDARIQAILRRGKPEEEASLLRAGPFRIDDRGKGVTMNGETVNLSPKEYALLGLLATDPGRVFSSKEIIDRLWPDKTRADATDVKQYIHLLRNKIEEDPTQPRWLQTVKGFGYKLEI